MQPKRFSFFAIIAGVVVASVASCRASAPPQHGETALSAPSASSSATSPAAEIPSLGAAAIDQMIAAEWQKQNITPAPPADDATFLRRAYLDIVGTIPPPDAVVAFTADTSPEKRKKMIDALLDSPAYADHWMNYWDDVLMGREVRGQIVDRVEFRRWLHSRFAANTRWNQIVTELVTATGQNSVGGPKAKVAAAMPIAEDKDQEEQATEENVNGAVNFALRFVEAPQDLAGTSSRTFLGVQIQCAQCHDHKTEKWKQEDFRQIASAFLHLRLKPVDQGKMGGEIRRIEVVDFQKVMPRVEKNADASEISKAKAVALDGTSLERGTATRKALATWMTARENPWFSKAIVNRMWGHFLGRGFVDPVDDIRPSNPAEMPELLDAMSKDFAAHDYDLKYLIREIASTRAYGLAASANAKTDDDNRAWAKFRLVPLGPEELLNALVRATNVDEAAKRAGIQNMANVRIQLVRAFNFLFDVDEEFDTHDYEGTVAQALTLLNGNLVNYGARAIPGTTLADVLADPVKGKDDAQVVDALYLRVLSRKPTADEVKVALDYVQNAHTSGAGTPGQPAPNAGAANANGMPGKTAKNAGKKGGGGDALVRLGNKNRTTADPHRVAFEDLTWALLNSSEFLFNH